MQRWKVNDVDGRENRKIDFVDIIQAYKRFCIDLLGELCYYNGVILAKDNEDSVLGSVNL